MLSASMCVYRQEQNWRDYIAQVGWSLGKLLSDEYPFPSWAELMLDEQEQPAGEDIYQTLVYRWGGGD